MPNIRLPQKYEEYLRAEKKISGLSKSDIIRRALDEYMEKRGKG